MKTAYANFGKTTDREWSEVDIAYLTKMYPTESGATIGAALGRSRSSVIGKAFRLKLTKKESTNEKSNRNTENKILAFTGYLSTQKSYREIEQGGREGMEPSLRYAVSR